MTKKLKIKIIKFKMNDDDEKYELIKNEYKYEINFYIPSKTPEKIPDLFFGKFAHKISNYNFEKRIKEINEIIENKKNKINIDTLKSYKEILEKILINVKEIRSKCVDDFISSSIIIGGLKHDYKKNKNKYDISGLYINLLKGTLELQKNTLIMKIKFFRLMILLLILIIN